MNNWSVIANQLKNLLVFVCALLHQYITTQVSRRSPLQPVQLESMNTLVCEGISSNNILKHPKRIVHRFLLSL